MHDHSQVVVALSGGMDSCVCAALAVRDFGANATAALHISYGQRTEARELAAFQAICHRLKIGRRLAVRTPFFRAIGGSALTDDKIAIPNAGPTIGAHIPVTYVPFRNAHFLSAAVSWAEVLGASQIYIGAVEQDSSGYPDCRPEFYQAFNQVIRTGTKEGKIRVETPLIALKKAQIVTLGLELDAPMDLTWSCYGGEVRACGVCESCVLRRAAFAAAGARDPLSYDSQTCKSVLNFGYHKVVTVIIPSQWVGGKMKKYISLAILLTCLAGICAAPAWAQLTGTVKGVAKDDAGKPIEGATVEILNNDTGRKINLKTNAKGEYFSIGVLPGTYKFSLIKDGKVIDYFDKVPVQVGAEREVNFDLAKEKSQAAQSAGISEEQQKKIAEVQKQNETIKGLNAKLAEARQLEAAGNYDQAVTLLQQAAQTDANQDVIWGSLGHAQLGAKKYPEAADSYQKALALKPSSGVYHSGLADAYAKSGQTDKAIQEWATAAQIDPANAGSYYYNEGAVLTNTGKIDEAIAAFDKSLQADPTRADAYYWKGVALMGKATTKGDKMVAPPGTAEAFNKYLELAPTGKFADPAKQMLATIGASVETTYGKSKTSSTTKKKPNN